MHSILTIAGFDTSGGAGIHADVKTARSLGFHVCSVVTAITFQNTCKISGVKVIEVEDIKNQLKSILEDIEISAVKIGMVPDVKISRELKNNLSGYEFPVVLDPVILSTTGYKLGSSKAYRELMSICDIITPNVYEAELLGGIKVNNIRDAKKSAENISDGFSVIITGVDGRDIVYDAIKDEFYIIGRKFHKKEVHGTGCVYSTALACYLTNTDLHLACKKARGFVMRVAKRSVEIGRCLPVVSP